MGINHNAPLGTRREIFIQASPEIVWDAVVQTIRSFLCGSIAELRTTEGRSDQSKRTAISIDKIS